MNTSFRSTRNLSLAILWMVTVLLLYFWIHKPLTSPLASAFGGATLDILSAFLITAIAGGGGRVVLRRLVPQWSETLSRPEQLVGEMLAGLGIVSVSMFLVGLVTLTMLSMGLLLVVLALVTVRGLLGWSLDLISAIRQLELHNKWEKGLAIFSGFNALMVLIMATAPPTAFDTLTYHLVGAKHWVADGKFHALTGNHFFGFPQLVNTLYAGQMALLSERLTGAAALHWMIGMAVLVGIGGYGTRRFNRFVGFLAPAILLTATSIWLQFSWAYIDLFTTACGLMTFVALDEWRRADDQNRTRWAMVVGVFVGLAMSAKYNAILLGVVAGIYILIYGWRLPKADLLRYAILFVLVASVVLMPWLLRNLAFFDNPIYPLGFTTGEWDELKAEWYQNTDDSILRTNPIVILPIFLTPTFLGVEGAGTFGSTLGPLFLMLIPMLLMTWKAVSEKWRGSLRGMLLLTILYHLLWLATTAYSALGATIRFVYPMFPWMALLAAAALDSLNTLPRKPLDFAWVMRTIVVLVLVLTAIAHVTGTRPQNNSGLLEGTTLTDHFVASRALEYALGMIDEDEYLDYRLGWSAVAIRTLNSLPDDSRILFLWETRSLYCDEPRISCEEDAILFNWWHARRTIGDGSAVAIVEDWQLQGITHVLVWDTGRDDQFRNNDLFTDDDKRAWDDMAQLLEIAWQGDDIYTLYQIPTVDIE